MNDFFLPAIKQNHLLEMQAVQLNLQTLGEWRAHLKSLIGKNQRVLEISLSEPDNPAKRKIIPLS
ncbi:MAG: hypothetical protein WBJ10_04140 [Daejeonella sp.]|uniref:hypothetical protein n=1 Tax=Daejeonella sp. TaxID=2805397 RepID=UPI003C78F27C